MSNQIVNPELWEELSTKKQQYLVGGRGYDNHHYNSDYFPFGGIGGQLSGINNIGRNTQADNIFIISPLPIFV